MEVYTAQSSHQPAVLPHHHQTVSMEFPPPGLSSSIEKKWMTPRTTKRLEESKHNKIDTPPTNQDGRGAITVDTSETLSGGDTLLDSSARVCGSGTIAVAHEGCASVILQPTSVYPTALPCNTALPRRKPLQLEPIRERYHRYRDLQADPYPESQWSRSQKLDWCRGRYFICIKIQ